MLISVFLIWVELALFEGPSFLHLLNHPGLKQQPGAAPFEPAPPFEIRGVPNISAMRKLPMPALSRARHGCVPCPHAHPGPSLSLARGPAAGVWHGRWGRGRGSGSAPGLGGPAAAARSPGRERCEGRAGRGSGTEGSTWDQVKGARAAWEGKVKNCAVGAERGHLVYQLSFAGQIPLPLPHLTGWDVREEVGEQKEVVPHHPSPPTPVLPDNKDLGFYTVAVSCCDIIPATVSGAPLFEPVVAAASHVAAQLYSDVMGRNTEDLGSLAN